MIVADKSRAMALIICSFAQMGDDRRESRNTTL